MNGRELLRAFQEARLEEWAGRPDQALEAYKRLPLDGAFGTLIAPIVDRRAKTLEKSRHAWTQVKQGVRPSAAEEGKDWQYGFMTRPYDHFHARVLLEVRGYHRIRVSTLRSGSELRVPGWTVLDVYHETVDGHVVQVEIDAKAERVWMDARLAITYHGIMTGRAITLAGTEEEALRELDSLLRTFSQAVWPDK